MHNMIALSSQWSIFIIINCSFLISGNTSCVYFVWYWFRYSQLSYLLFALGIFFYPCVVIVESLSCIQLFWDPMDYSLSGFSVPGISWARILEWVAIFFSMGAFWPKDGSCVPCIGRRILYHWAAREAPSILHLQ